MAEFKECEVIMRLSPKVGYDPTEGICVAAEKIAELVRCKDCKWHEDDEFCQVLQWERGMFYHTNIWTMTDDDYCSRGERKAEVEDG